MLTISPVPYDALVGAFSKIVKTDVSFAALMLKHVQLQAQARHFKSLTITQNHVFVNFHFAVNNVHSI